MVFLREEKSKFSSLWVGDLHWQGFSSFWLVIPHFWWLWPKIKWGDIVLSNCAFEFWAYGWLARILSLCSMLVLMGTCSKNVFVQCTHLWWCKVLLTMEGGCTSTCTWLTPEPLTKYFVLSWGVLWDCLQKYYKLATTLDRDQGINNYYY